MARIAGIDLTEYKRVDIALTKIYGIGRNNVKRLLEKGSVDGAKRVSKLTEEEISRLHKLLDKEFKVEGDLKIEVAENIKRLKEINSYRGLRHLRGLPSRGQRTRSNARTKRGKRRTVGAMRKETRTKMERAPTSRSTTDQK